jgi:O-antigen ligase
MFVAWVFLAIKYPEFRPPRSKVLLAFSLYVLASLLAALWGVNPTHSLWSSYDRMTGVVDLIHWLMFALVLVSVVRLPKDWTALFNWQLAITVVLSLIALGQAYGQLFIPSLVAPCRVYATLGNPSFLAPILVVSILLATGLFLRSIWDSGSESGPAISEANQGDATVASSATPKALVASQAFWLIVIGLGIFTLILTGTRGALIGLVAGILVMPVALAIWGNRSALKATSLAAAGLLTAVGLLLAVDLNIGIASPHCASATSSNRLTDLASTGTADGSLANRLASIEAGFQGFLERPVFGWGPENFGYAFDRHVDAWVFRLGSFVQDKAHNQVIEELTTKGVVGILAFSFMWLVLVWVVVSRKRPASEDALAYAVLGALAGYFVQNLFLFDTPSTLLVWLVLVGWVATQERKDTVTALDKEESSRLWSQGLLLPRIQRTLQSILSDPWGRGAAAVGLLAILAISLYSFNLQPYLAARTFGQASRLGVPTSERLDLAEESFKTFPAMANQPRQLMMLQFVRLWRFLSDEERSQVRGFFAREAALGLSSDAGNAPLLITAILFIQSTEQRPEVLAALGPMLRQLQEIAPNRAETHQLLANQALIEGRYAEALSIVQEYQSVAPDTDLFFVDIKQAARQGLGEGAD